MNKTTFLEDIIEIKEISFATSSNNIPSNRIIDMMYLEDNRLFLLKQRGKNL